MKNVKFLLLSALSGVILSLSWPEIGDLSILAFFGLVPLLFLEHSMVQEKVSKLKLKVFGYSYLAFLIFNFVTTWWIKNASFSGMIMAEVFNSLFMAFIFLLFHISKNKLGEKQGYIALVIYWLAFEWVHYHWDLSWVWLTFGNVFANNIKWVQWYEYTGVLGGSLWMLVTNILFYLTLKNVINNSFFGFRTWLTSIIATVVIVVPISLSNCVYNNYEEPENPIEVVVVQPNIDPYNEKFYGMSESDQIDLMVNLAKLKMTEKTDFIVYPETAFPMGYWEHELDYTYGVEEMRKILKEHPEIRIITGLSSKKLYAPGEETSPTARTFKDGTNNAYDFYNTGMQLAANNDLQLYHKSKLVLGVEKMPFGTLLKPIEKLSIKLGGASGSLGYEESPFNFIPTSVSSSQSSVAPVICYESIYGSYIAEYVKKGAEWIAIITNDGWWGDTPGYRQHLAYARLRAIEMRRSIARSANTGVSAFINQRGDVISPTEWWTRLSIGGTINTNKYMTFYALNGNFIGRVSAFFALLVVALTLVKSISAPKKIAVK